MGVSDEQRGLHAAAVAAAGVGHAAAVAEAAPAAEQRSEGAAGVDVRAAEPGAGGGGVRAGRPRQGRRHERRRRQRRRQRQHVARLLGHQLLLPVQLPEPEEHVIRIPTVRRLQCVLQLFCVSGTPPCQT